MSSNERNNFSFHADEIGTISFPYLLLKVEDQITEDYKYDELEEESSDFDFTGSSESESVMEGLNKNETKEYKYSDNESQRGKGKNDFLWRKYRKYNRKPEL